MQQQQNGGITVARVHAVGEGEHLGCVQVQLAWEEQPRRQWLAVASPMAGAERGWFVMPVVGDEVIVAFDQAQFDHGYVIGFLWNRQHKPPSEDPRQRIFRSQNGHCIRFIDAPEKDGDKGQLVIEDASRNTIVFANSHITITARGLVAIDAPAVTILGRPVRQVGPPI
ncbi:phage baseplate assembly protein V [Aquincola sp. MAHUQ-54]|uniref:Phage baseplate assembly protein V n=1 Tax=Aquincola agrisoli TaxID=3119538 RepID=A0AAW9QMY8_9BURK